MVLAGGGDGWEENQEVIMCQVLLDFDGQTLQSWLPGPGVCLFGLGLEMLIEVGRVDKWTLSTYLI